MKNMVFVMMIILLSSSLYGKSVYDEKYQMHSNVFLEDFDISNAKRTEVYFGTKDDYVDSIDKDLSFLALSSANGIASGISSQAGALAKGFTQGVGSAVGAGLGIGLVIAAVDYYKKQKGKPLFYYYVVEFEDKSGKKTRGIVNLISYDKEFKETEEKDIKEIMVKGF